MLKQVTVVAINDLYAKICVPDVVKDLNVKVFNLMSRTNETKNIKWHETCKCERRLDAIVCNDKQRWNKDKWNGYWNPSNCGCKCDKSCDVGEYLDYKNLTCKRRLVDKLVEERNETIDEGVRLAIIIPVENSCMNNSCTVDIASWSIFLAIIVIGACFAYYKYRNRF